MTRNIDIAPEVRHLLRGEGLTRAIEAADGEYTCHVCREEVPLHDDESVSIVLGLLGDNALPLFWCCHTRCLSSQVLEEDYHLDVEAVGELAMFWALAVRWARPPRAILVLESQTTVLEPGTSLDVLAHEFVRQGWVTTTEGVDKTDAPEIRGMSLQRDPSGLTLLIDSVEAFSCELADPEPGWLQSARVDGSVLIVYGHGIHFKRLGVEGLAQAAQLGRCVAAAAEFVEKGVGK